MFKSVPVQSFPGVMLNEYDYFDQACDAVSGGQLLQAVPLYIQAMRVAPPTNTDLIQDSKMLVEHICSILPDAEKVKVFPFLAEQKTAEAKKSSKDELRGKAAELIKRADELYMLAHKTLVGKNYEVAQKILQEVDDILALLPASNEINATRQLCQVRKIECLTGLIHYHQMMKTVRALHNEAISLSFRDTPQAIKYCQKALEQLMQLPSTSQTNKIQKSCLDMLQRVFPKIQQAKTKEKPSEAKQKPKETAEERTAKTTQKITTEIAKGEKSLADKNFKGARQAFAKARRLNSGKGKEKDDALEAKLNQQLARVDVGELCAEANKHLAANALPNVQECAQNAMALIISQNIDSVDHEVKTFAQYCVTCGNIYLKQKLYEQAQTQYQLAQQINNLLGSKKDEVIEVQIPQNQKKIVVYQLKDEGDRILNGKAIDKLSKAEMVYQKALNLIAESGLGGLDDLKRKINVKLAEINRLQPKLEQSTVKKSTGASPDKEKKDEVKATEGQASLTIQKTAPVAEEPLLSLIKEIKEIAASTQEINTALIQALIKKHEHLTSREVIFSPQLGQEIYALFANSFSLRAFTLLSHIPHCHCLFPEIFASLNDEKIPVAKRQKIIEGVEGQLMKSDKEGKPGLAQFYLNAGLLLWICAQPHYYQKRTSGYSRDYSEEQSSYYSCLEIKSSQSTSMLLKAVPPEGINTFDFKPDSRTTFKAQGIAYYVNFFLISLHKQLFPYQPKSSSRPMHHHYPLPMGAPSQMPQYYPPLYSQPPHTTYPNYPRQVSGSVVGSELRPASELRV